MRRTLIFFLFFFISTFTWGQDVSPMNWVDGSYYDLEGYKITGLIGMHLSEKSRTGKVYDNYITFKKTIKDPEHDIYFEKIKAYVLGADSFVVCHKPNADKILFVKVLINEAVKLYGAKQLITEGTGKNFKYAMVYKYYYGFNPDYIKPLERHNFIDAMCKILADKPEMCKRIKKRELSYDDIPQIIVYCVSGKS